ncbi:TlpA disulfide reductase family protein [Pontimicrobium sp. SW4]|uniref:TlpA disulfide reductase family protein n=1 Tax=Pontimicrobium sp. SW4 TaxID=3153519 RepID=A0AAU7BP40_9FLAO
MKKTFLLLVLVILNYSCNKTQKQEPLTANTYEISVTAKGVVNGLRAYIKTAQGNREAVIDTAIVMNEQFVFSGKVASPSIQTITINGVKGTLPFVFESGRTLININKDSLFNSKVEGSQNNKDYNGFKQQYKKKADAINALNAEYGKAADQESRNKIIEKARQLNKEIQEFSMDFIADNPNSAFSLLLLETQIANKDINLEKLKSNYNALQSVINKNAAFISIGAKIKSQIEIIEASASLNIGKIAPNFTSPSIDGEMISLNDIKGKATIIEFWASWCGPCRRENPNIVRVYEKYKDKGLAIIGVSLDKPGNKARWQKAIEDDNLNWYHVGSLQYFNDPVARMYDINSIPASFILDENGKIVAKKLRGSDLEKQIASMLD